MFEGFTVLARVAICYGGTCSSVCQKGSLAVVDGSIVHLAHTTVGVMPVVVNGDYILNFGFGKRMSSPFSFAGTG